MAPIEAKILHQERNDQGQVQALTGQLGNVVIQARGIGSLIDNSAVPKLGFPHRWASGFGPNITQAENRDFIAEQVAGTVAEVSDRRGFGKKVDMVRLASTSAPLGTEARVRQLLKEKYKIEVERTIRDSTACSGSLFALTEEIRRKSLNDLKVIIAACEHLSPFSEQGSLLQALFGDAVSAMAFKGGKGGDLSVIAEHALFEQDDPHDPVLTLPHAKIGTLPPQEGRVPLRERKGSCEVRGSRGHVFTYQGGVWQPIQEAEDAVMNGGKLLTYFASTTPQIMDLTMEEYLAKQGGQGSVNLNQFGVIHQPSHPLLHSLINHIDKSDLPLQKSRVGKTERTTRPGLSVRGRVQHEWTPTLETTTLHHNNASGVTWVLSLLAMIEAGLITKEHVLATAMGVGNNVVSAVINVNKPATTRTVHRVHLPHL